MKSDSVLRKIVFALIIFVIFGEWGLRPFKNQVHIYYPSGKTFPPIYETSDTHAFSLRPGIDARHYNYFNEFVKDYHINKSGTRGYNEDGEIVMLGDSFVFGTGLNDDETVAYNLEKISGVRVVNAGVPGYAIDNSYIIARSYPCEKIKVVGFFLGNDIKDIKNHNWIEDRFGLPVIIEHKKMHVDDYHHLTEKTSGSSPVKEFLRNNSFFYTVLSEHRYILKWNLEELADKLKTIGAKNKKKEGGVAPKVSKPEIADNSLEIGKAKKILKTLNNENNKLLVVIIMSRDPKEPELVCAEKIESYMKQENINFIVIGDKPDSYYYKKDCHWTKEGSKSAANDIYNKLKELCWL